MHIQVERALTKWKTGTLEPYKNRRGQPIDTFSHKVWGAKTEQYLDSISNLTESEWQEIIKGAQHCLGKDAGEVGGNELDNDDNDEGESDEERARIM